MPDRKPFLSRLVVRVAVLALVVYLGVLGVERWYRYCDYRMTMSPTAAIRRTLTFADPPLSDFTSPGNFTEIEPGLIVGGALAEPPPGASAVLNLCEIKDPYEDKVTHKWMKIPDAAPAPDLDWLKQAVGFVTEQRQDGKTVYIHCAAGISRAGMVSTAYLMADRGWSRDQALEYIREKRQVNPNPAFMDRLLEWEKVVAPEK